MFNCDDVLTFGWGPLIRIHPLVPPKGLNEVPTQGFEDDVPMVIDEVPNMGFEELAPIDVDPKVVPTICEDVIDIAGMDCDIACDIVGVPPIDVALIELEVF